MERGDKLLVGDPRRWSGVVHNGLGVVGAESPGRECSQVVVDEVFRRCSVDTRSGQLRDNLLFVPRDLSTAMLMFVLESEGVAKFVKHSRLSDYWILKLVGAEPHGWACIEPINAPHEGRRGWQLGIVGLKCDDDVSGRGRSSHNRQRGLRVAPHFRNT